MKLLRLSAAIALGLSVAAAAQAADEVAAVIAKARAYLGSDEALDRIKAVRYIGTLEGTDATGKVLKGKLDVTFQSPNRMLQVMAFADRIETTGLDDFTSWFLEQKSANPAQYRFAARGLDAVTHARASVWENLAYYKGIESVGGRVEDAGTVTVDGKPAHKLIFRHGEKISFARWFAPATGQLLLTETEDGTAIREEGEMPVAGVRFPKKTINTPKSGSGSLVIIFDKVIINEPLSEKSFAPQLSPPSATSLQDALKLPKLGTDLAPARN